MSASNQIGTPSPGIVICSRLGSSRIPQKAIADLNGVPLIRHLVLRLLPTKIPIIVAVPSMEVATYQNILSDLFPQVRLHSGMAEDPLARMDIAARRAGFDSVIRITHDKIFVDPADIKKLLKIYYESNLDYIYSSSFLPGTGFEIIRQTKLHEACVKFKNVEHISYAVRAITDRITDVDMGYRNTPHRMLVDYDDDLFVLSSILFDLGNNCTKEMAVEYLEKYPKVSSQNRLPILSVYTCAYNAQKWLSQCVGSVVEQSCFSNIEYLLVDDGSGDETLNMMREFEGQFDNVRVITNLENVGLSSSCNRALTQARGKYILRLDADDRLAHPHSLETLIDGMRSGFFDAIYPDFYWGAMHVIERGNVHHHAGGAIFDSRALNHMRFTDGLRGLEGYDLYERAKTQLRIGYSNTPLFFYRQHNASMSKECPQKRAEIKRGIDARIASGD